MRLHLVGAVAALVVAGLATPAEAAEVPLVAVAVPRQVTVVEGQTTSVTATVSNTGAVAAGAVAMRFGSPLRPMVDSMGLAVAAGCDTQGCYVGDLAPGASRRFTFTLTPAGAPLTSTFDLIVGGAAGVLGQASPVTVVRTGDGVDLELAAVGDLDLGAGESADVPVLVRNAGSAPVDGIGLVVAAEPGIEAAAGERRCQAGAGAVICRFARRLPPGGTFTTPLRITVAEDAAGPHRYPTGLAAVGLIGGAAAAGRTGGAAADPADPGRPGVGRTGGAAADPADPGLTGGAAADPAGPGRPDVGLRPEGRANMVSFGVRTGLSGADSAAVGGAFTGAVGDRRTVRVGVRNAGPAGVVPAGAGWRQTVRVTVPPGVRLIEVDDDCVPAAAESTAGFDFESAGSVRGNVYTCVVLSPLGSGAERDFAFVGEITGRGGKPGAVIVDGGTQDSTAANDQAELTVRLTAGGRGAGATLAGAPTGWVTFGGAVLLIIGVVAFRRARRRRIRAANVGGPVVPRQGRPVVEVSADAYRD